MSLAAISCGITGYAGVDGSCICDFGYAGTVTYLDGAATGCSANDCLITDVDTDNGSNGYFYCINGGTIAGTTGSCTCTSCDPGYSGSSCETGKE